MNQRRGIIYPLLPEHIERIFDRKDVFCKFTATGSKTTKGHKLLFYSSRGNFEIRGEATVDDVEYLTPDEAIRKYGKRLFITPEEMNSYCAKRDRPPDKKLLVMVLQKIREYPKPHKLEKPIPMSGMVLTDTMYKKILGSVSMITRS